MTQSNIDWTHKNIQLSDIRKLNKLYVFKVHNKSNQQVISGDPALFVKDTIFEERINSYFLKYTVSREEILNVFWNMYITKGYYIKVNDKGEIENFNMDPDKWYVSYLEIDGPLGSFCSAIKNQ